MSKIPYLDPGQLERLALLGEELGEAMQVIGKILRHGYSSCHPAGGANNRELLQEELGHIRFAVDLCKHRGDLDQAAINGARDDKLRRVDKYLHHNNTFGMGPTNEDEDL